MGPQRCHSAVRAGISRGLRRGILRASGPVVLNLEIALADLGSTVYFGRLRRAVVGKVAIRKRERHALCLNNEREAGGHGLAPGVRTRDIKGRNARLGWSARERQPTRSTG